MLDSVECQRGTRNFILDFSVWIYTKNPSADRKMMRFHNAMQDIDDLTYPFDYLFLGAFVPETFLTQIPWQRCIGIMNGPYHIPFQCALSNKRAAYNFPSAFGATAPDNTTTGLTSFLTDSENEICLKGASTILRVLLTRLALRIRGCGPRFWASAICPLADHDACAGIDNWPEHIPRV
jgi:hypothetical protein